VDEQERRRRLRTYGFAAVKEMDQPSQDGPSTAAGQASRTERADRVAADVSAGVAASMAEIGAAPVPGVRTRILDSLGFRYGLVVTTLGFVAGLLWVIEIFPGGALELALAGRRSAVTSAETRRLRSWPPCTAATTCPIRPWRWGRGHQARRRPDR